MSECMRCKAEQENDQDPSAKCDLCSWDEVEDEQDFLVGATCNPNAPEECESCQ